jgi:hypothetical protein
VAFNGIFVAKRRQVLSCRPPRGPCHAPRTAMLAHWLFPSLMPRYSALQPLARRGAHRPSPPGETRLGLRELMLVAIARCLHLQPRSTRLCLSWPDRAVLHAAGLPLPRPQDVDSGVDLHGKQNRVPTARTTASRQAFLTPERGNNHQLERVPRKGRFKLFLFAAARSAEARKHGMFQRISVRLVFSSGSM